MNMQNLATKSGISYSTIVDLWHDRTRRIDKDTLSRLCLALGTTPGELLAFDEETEEEIDSPALALA